MESAGKWNQAKKRVRTTRGRWGFRSAMSLQQRRVRAVLGKRQTEGELEATYQLMHDGMDLAEKEIRLAGNGQAARFIHELFAQAVTSDFEGSVRCTAPKDGRFSGVELELDAGNRVFTKLPVAPVRR